MTLSRKSKYLQIALNSTLEDARNIISELPASNRILLEAGTPLIKQYGIGVIRDIYYAWSRKNTEIRPYIVADLKTMDRAATEVTMAHNAGASAAICLGQAPVETIHAFIETCSKLGMDSMLDMMNVEHPINVLRTLKKQPNIVILHRGVDEETYNKRKPIPYININKVLSSYTVMISIAGGDTVREVQRAIFNGAHIVIVWRDFFESTLNTSALAQEFLKEIK